MPFLIDLYEDYGLPDWRIFETADEREVRERQEKEKSIFDGWIKKYNVPTNIQKNLGGVTDKYFLIKRFFDSFEYCHYYWIYSRQPDGRLGEKKGELKFFETREISFLESREFPLIFCRSDVLNKMCDEEIQRAESLRIAKNMQDRFGV
jgi:hypothetical protein